MNKGQSPLIAIGYIEYGATTAPYLPFFLESLTRQTYSNVIILSHDNTPGEGKDNIGFSRAYNKLIGEAIAQGAEYFLVINPDTIHEPDMIEKLAAALENNHALGSVSPKILSWDFSSNTKTNIIDSCGLRLHSALEFRDIGQGEVDRGQYDKTAILGPSGAAGLFRLSALKAIQENNQYFDERFFMYKEDCDLAYRLHMAGFASALIPQALAYHDRTASGGTLSKRLLQRWDRTRSAKGYSFVNQHLLYRKYWTQQTSKDKFLIILHVFMRFGAAIVLEPYLLAHYRYIIKRI